MTTARIKNAAAIQAPYVTIVATRTVDRYTSGAICIRAFANVFAKSGSARARFLTEPAENALTTRVHQRSQVLRTIQQPHWRPSTRASTAWGRT